MQVGEFFWRIEEDKDLRGVDLQIGDDPAEDIMVVEDLHSGYKTRFSIPAILENDWPMLRDIALGRKSIQPLYHVTRIVGYYSRIENWNKSKIGELVDRRHGNYALVT
ncbi:MAG TPA: hypothetical protein VM223_16540 [Planctomycetota bacterium]|nr:hypothetical protein [Planctomycetota bacterium]